MALSGKSGFFAQALESAPKRGASRPANPRPIGLNRPRQPLAEMSLRTATAWSVGLHTLGPVVLALLTVLVLFLLSWLLNINWLDWFKTPEKPKDLVFTLVEDRGVEAPKDARFKGEFNQQAGGKNDPKKPIEPDDKPMQAAATPPAPQPVTPPQPQQQAQVQPPEPQADTQPRPKLKPTIATPAKPAAPQPASQHKTATQAPEPMVVASAGAPSPVPSFGKDGAFGNPEGGNNPTAGVNVVADPDFGPFMSDLQKRIKRNWTPPRGAESQQVKLLFDISREGKLVKIEVAESSGNPLADEAAVRAVQASAPFRPFPPEVQDEVLPIEFTFDYNVFNPSKRAFKR